MSVSQRVINSVYNLIIEKNMIEKGDRVLVAVSGGADSVCLLSILCSLKDRLGICLSVAHLNHMIRGEEAKRDENFVKSLCEKYGINCFVKSVDVPRLAEEKGISLEEAGRDARYSFFDELKKTEGITKIATAHNKNDRAESVLMRIIRGTGIDGLKGISYVREDGVIRPVLDLKRCEIEEYLKDINLEFCTDSTNGDNDYTRNRIRNGLIPYIEENFNPSVVDTLFRFSETLTEDAEFLDGYANRLYERINNPLPSHKPYALHIDSLKMVDDSIRARLVKIVAGKAAGKDLKLQYVHIQNVLELINKNTGAMVNLPDGIEVRCEYGWLIFENTKKETEITNIEEEDLFIRVNPLESYYIESLDAEISFKIVDPKIYKKNPRQQIVDFDILEGKKLVLRTRRSGDKMVCFPDGKSKKLKNIFIDSKIPKASRDKIPVLCGNDEIVAVVGLRVSENYKIKNETRKALIIEYRKSKNND